MSLFHLVEHIEIFKIKALELAVLNATSIQEKEHVTPFIYNKLRSRCSTFSSGISPKKIQRMYGYVLTIKKT